MKQESRLKLLVRMMNRWVDMPGKNRSIVCQEIVEAVDATGMRKTLEQEGIIFNSGGDLYHDMRVNAQKIFRWLGVYDEVHAFPDRLFFIEPVIIAAMPGDLRTEYLNSVYAVSGVMVCNRTAGQGAGAGLQLLKAVMKEQSEAQVSLLDHESVQTVNSARKAHREISEAVAVGSAVMGELERRIKELSAAD